VALTGRQKAQAKYNSKPEQKKRRAARNKARRMLERQGKVRKGDGKDIDHKDHNPHNNSSSNLQVQSKHVNRKDGGAPRKRTAVQILTNPKRKKRKK
jgi:hypothetical protein